ncbi:MAG: tRNA lysidine(34) synthetase TilS [Bacillota bacterium]
MTLVERVEQTILKKQLLQPGGRLVVAVSAGPDSVCLLRVLHQLAPRYDWSLVVAHLNHGFRGAAARADADFVRQLAEHLGWPSHVHTMDIPALLAAQGGSSQAVSRAERYRFLRQVATAENAQAILLAHHRGDQAETVLQHLLRGAGSGGLSGMSMREEMEPCPLVRPLLGESQLQIMRYLQSCGQSFRIDHSNAESLYQRNRLRWETVPFLARLNGDIETALARSADLLQAEDQLLHQQAREAYRSALCPEPHPSAIALSLSGLQQLPLALLRRVLRLAWQELTGTTQDLEYSHVEAAVGLIHQPVGSACNWPQGFACRISYQQLVISPGEGKQVGFCLSLPVPGRVVLPQGLGEIQASLLPRSALPAQFGPPNRAYCDLHAFRQRELTVRSWLPGDQFWPLGLKGGKKLQDFFVDAKVPRHLRQQIPLVFCGEELVWVAGMRLAHPFRVKACSEEIVCLEYSSV